MLCLDILKCVVEMENVNSTSREVDLTHSSMGPYLHSVGELSCEKCDSTVPNVTSKRYYILTVKDVYCVTGHTVRILASF
jgi:hypothetical protein